MISSGIAALLPEWFLPDHIIIKMQKQGDEYEEEMETQNFDNEVNAYARLKPLQGVVVPKLYGQVRLDGKRALLLQNVGGVSLGDPGGATLGLKDLVDKLLAAYGALAAFSGLHDDSNC